MGRTALYRDDVWRPARAEVTLEPTALTFVLPGGRRRRFDLDGCEPVATDGCIAKGERVADEGVGQWRPGATSSRGVERRFVKMLALERGGSPQAVVVTPPEEGAVAPKIVSVPEAPKDAAIVDAATWDALAGFILGGGRVAALAVADLARLAMIATPQFAILIGEVAAQRALDWVAMARGPVRGVPDLDLALQPLFVAARTSQRAGEALIAALAYAAGSARRRRRYR